MHKQKRSILHGWVANNEGAVDCIAQAFLNFYNQFIRRCFNHQCHMKEHEIKVWAGEPSYDKKPAAVEALANIQLS